MVRTGVPTSSWHFESPCQLKLGMIHARALAVSQPLRRWMPFSTCSVLALLTSSGPSAQWRLAPVASEQHKCIGGHGLLAKCATLLLSLLHRG